jgi:hypothetical protein
MRSSLLYDSHGRSNFALSRRDPLRELRLYRILGSSPKRSSRKFALPAVSEVACPSAPAGAAELPPRPYAS